MSGIMEIDNYAFTVEHEKADDPGENLMYAMFSFDRLREQGPPAQFVVECPSADTWALFLLKHLSDYYGVDPAHILRDWAEYNALPGSTTYYKLKALIAEAKGE